MEMRVLKYFLAVAEAGSITEGSRRLHVTQPSVSRQLRALEQELGVDLFRRGHGALSLTHAGRRFLDAARDLVLREQMARNAVGLDRIRGTRLTAVAPFTTIIRSLAPFTAERGADHPVIDALECEPVAVFERTRMVNADLGISTVAPPADWASRRLVDVGITAHVSGDHPLAGRSDVEITELARHPLVLMDRTNMARLAFDEAVATAGVDLPEAIEMSSSFMAQGLAAGGRGAAVLTNAPAFGLHAVRIMLDGAQIRLTLHAGWDPSHYATGPISRWIDDFAGWLQHIPDAVHVDDPPGPAAPG
ncbi:LysR substrate-binding domain-containing protein [Amycolatopsis endophytica]|uniref:DNA-binding transcriptional LysR family regulator n=1 Tax=Amycolatopsis endophytica TaxID=860233 RepID=A0A853B6B1_9PSEU|nr:LysR family transcriptional regulator [Amycolatopsis endophytica]NYI90783.1 DNA-binding transcriptional LysR family regulator [Amycolatopsis endophytica]